MTERESFVFYRSFYEAIKCLTPEESAESIKALCEYALNGNEVNLSGVPKAIFTLIKPQIDANIRRREQGKENGKKGAEYGKLGGRPKKETPKKPLKNPQDNPQKPSNVNVNVNENVNVNDIDKVNYQEIANLYNGMCKSLPQVTRLSDKRKQVIKSRLKRYSIDDLKKAFQMAEDSDFLSGRSGKWTGANFDWLMNETNLVKVLEGNYRNNKTTKIEIDSNFRSFLESNEVVNWD